MFSCGMLIYANVQFGAVLLAANLLVVAIFALVGVGCRNKWLFNIKNLGQHGLQTVHIFGLYRCNVIDWFFCHLDNKPGTLGIISLMYI